jgi:hypothetical protein
MKHENNDGLWLSKPITRVQIPAIANEICNNKEGSNPVEALSKRLEKRKIWFGFKAFLNEAEETTNALLCN